MITCHFSAALPILSVPIVNVDTTLSELTYNDDLIYHYARGIVFGALKRWKEAEEFFEIVVTSLAQTTAAIQLEALKKLTLVQLILYGKVFVKVNMKLRLTRNRGHAGDSTTKVHQRDAHTPHQVCAVQQLCACIPSSFTQQSDLQRRRCVQNGECLAVHYYSGSTRRVRRRTKTTVWCSR